MWKVQFEIHPINRKIRPTYLKECKEFVLKSLGGYRVCSVETDDFVQTRMYELNQQGIKGNYI